MILRDDQIQAAWITLLKGNSAILADVAAAQIKENQPQSTDFSYPAIRVRVGPNTPVDDDCGQNVVVSIGVFSEEASSQQCMRIAGIIVQQYHNKSFGGSGLGADMNFTNLKATLVPAIRQDRLTWRSEVTLTMLVKG